MQQCWYLSRCFGELFRIVERISKAIFTERVNKVEINQ